MPLLSMQRAYRSVITNNSLPKAKEVDFNNNWLQQDEATVNLRNCDIEGLSRSCDLKP